MVEDFVLTGKNVPSVHRLLHDITTGKIPTVVICTNHSGKTSICMGFVPMGETKIPGGHFIHMYHGKWNGKTFVATDTIGFFSRYGSNFESIKVLNAIADYYGVGIVSNSDGVLRSPKIAVLRRWAKRKWVV